MSATRAQLIEAIRRAASRDPYCTYAPGPYLAGVYADAVLAVMESAEPWHGKATHNG
jgi:hypothetical protein